MADAVTTQVILDNIRNYVVKCTNVSDQTGETNVVKVNGSTVNNGNPLGHWTIWRLRYDIKGGRLRIIWGGSTPAVAFVLGGFIGGFVHEHFGGVPNNATVPDGNILFTFDALPAAGVGVGSGYTVIMELKKNIQQNT